MPVICDAQNDNWVALPSGPGCRALAYGARRAEDGVFWLHSQTGVPPFTALGLLKPRVDLSIRQCSSTL